jgi:hypothetical protein
LQCCKTRSKACFYSQEATFQWLNEQRKIGKNLKNCPICPKASFERHLSAVKLQRLYGKILHHLYQKGVAANDFRRSQKPLPQGNDSNAKRQKEERCHCDNRTPCPSACDLWAKLCQCSTSHVTNGFFHSWNGTFPSIRKYNTIIHRPEPLFRTYTHDRRTPICR